MNAPARPAASAVRTTCPYCGVGCGILARSDGKGGAVISGDPDHPANFGKLCSKGFALAESFGMDGRLLHPMVRGADGELKQASWNDALDRVADGFRKAMERDGPDAVAFYLSGQLLTEDYYVANKLMKGFIGSGNVDTNSRLCMASTVAGHRRAFGGDVVPGSYDDLDRSDLIVLVGSNTAWCHPVLYQRMVAARKARGTKLVVIDPRCMITGKDSDLFLGIAPGMDTVLFSGLLAYLADNDALNRAYIEAHTNGLDAALARARVIAPDVDTTARLTSLSQREVLQFFELFRATRRTVTCFSQGVNQSTQGTDKVNAIINCHLATGRIGRPGMGPFSLTGQPNAMGGREVGGLANQLAAHMDFAPENVDRVRRFWRAPQATTGPGLTAVPMFEAIERGKIKALWVMGTNPAASLPRAGAVRDALRRLELFVVSDVTQANDTIDAGPDVLLPAEGWGEKSGTVTNSERRISRQRSFIPPTGEARPDWWMLAEVARRLGFGEAFGYRSAAEIFREHAALSAFENDGARGFDIGALASIADAQYDELEPVQWPQFADRAGCVRLFASGGFFTSDRKARFVAPEAPALRSATSKAFPLRLNTGRVRDQWHTMTRTGLCPTLSSHRPEPRVEISRTDAVRYRLCQDGFARIATAHGAGIFKVEISDAQPRGSIFVPIHWTDQTASSARVGDLVGADLDPHSGQPEVKATPAAIQPVEFQTSGFALSRAPLRLPEGTWWARSAVAGGWAYAVATNNDSESWHRFVLALFGEGAALTEYIDRARRVYRVAAFVEGRLHACVFLGGGAHFGEQWRGAREMFAQGGDVAVAHAPGGPAGTGPDPLICACFGVGLQAITTALASQQIASVEQIGRALRAGTKCGSCLPELRSIASHEALAQAG
jgi:assimilatory nitrate reductase catalytic subunit